MRHQFQHLLRRFIRSQLMDYRSRSGTTQERMAELLFITPRSYAYLERGTYGCSAATLMFFILTLPEDEVLRLRAEFLILVEENRYAAV